MSKEKEQKEVADGNKLIAEFMGWIYFEANPAKHFRYDYYKKTDGNYFDAWKLQYHSSWDWLMPVVQKIMKMPLDKFEITNSHTYLVWSEKIKIMCGCIKEYDEGTCGTMVYKYIPTETGINATWRTVVEFINHHNQNKKI